MGKARTRKECVLTNDFLDRFGRAVAACIAEGNAKEVSKDDGKPIYKIEAAALELAMDDRFAGYKLGDKVADAYASNDADRFDSGVALTYLRMQVRGECGKPLVTVKGEEQEGTFMGKDFSKLGAIGDTLALEPKEELRKPDVMGAYVEEIDTLPDVPRTYKHEVDFAIVNTAVLAAIKAKAAEPPIQRQ